MSWQIAFKISLVITMLIATSCSALELRSQSPDQEAENRTDQHWSFFRGNNFDGHSLEKGITESWPERGPPVLWHLDLGVGYSGFVGQSGRVYTQYQNLSGQFVACLNAKTGEKIWEQKYAWPYKPASLYPGPRSTPTLCDGRLFVTTPASNLLCYDAESGDLKWEVGLAEKFSAPKVEFGYACSPVCHDGKVFLPIGGKDASMVALNQTDGSIVWHAGNDPVSYCSAYPIEFENRKLIVGYFKNTLCLFDQETGNELASIRVSVDYDEHSAWPVYREPFLWVSGPFRAGSRLYRLESEIPAKEITANVKTETESSESKLLLKHVYASKKMSNDVASCVLSGEQLYGFDIRDVQSKVHRPSRGQFTCMEFLTGEVAWQNGTIRRQQISTQPGIIDETVASESVVAATDIGHASVIVADGKLIMLNDTGELILGRIGSESFEELARTTILGGEISWTQPILIDGCLFARNHTKAVCVYLGEVDELAGDPNQLTFASDIRQATYVDWASLILGTEPTYAMTAPKPKWLVRWFLISLALGWLLAPIVAVTFRYFSKTPSTRTTFLCVAMAIGIFGTTIFGHWLKEFYFSWPICLAILFESLVCQLKSKNESVKPRPWLARLMLIMFAIACVGFFLLCRRLSLPFEWTFLLGFPAALPFHWMVKQSVQRGESFGFGQWLWSLLGFSAFFWLGAGVMIWKYAA